VARRVAANGRESLELRQGSALRKRRTKIPLIEGGEGRYGPTTVSDDDVLP
jgi:hypothetical protein